MLLEGAHRRHREDPAHPEGAQGPEVGPVGHLGGGVAVVAAVAGQEHHLQISQPTEPQAVGGIAIGGFHRDLAQILQPLHGIEAAAAKHAQTGLGQLGGGAAGHSVIQNWHLSTAGLSCAAFLAQPLVRSRSAPQRGAAGWSAGILCAGHSSRCGGDPRACGAPCALEALAKLPLLSAGWQD